ncbi:HAD-IA family hydrolase [Haloactinopolyspora sp.]|uniref:HAD-IA family hydrolase n=1 Tax=Haloactinopolyspora sp. TaxID=1966353 RepID=UPI00262597E1|nr:HAD-IA family hydrolase [Haloactinopolyspora sp.]
MLTADALLLDLDGTLVDSSESIVRSWLRWAAEFDVDPARLADSHGRTSADIVADLVPDTEVEHALARIDELEIDDAGTVRAMPGAAEFLAALPPSRWAIVTSGNARLARARIEAAALPGPKVLVTADDVTRGKPDPEPFLLGATRLDVDPRGCVVVEDAPSGIAAARAAGMDVIAVTSTYPRERLDADLHVSSPAGLEVDGPGPVRLRRTRP